MFQPQSSRGVAEQEASGERDEIRRMVRESFPPPPITLPAAAPQPATVTQPFRVLVACDLSDLSEGVLIEALQLVRGEARAELHIITVVQHAGREFRLNDGASHPHMTLEQVQAQLDLFVRQVLDASIDRLDNVHANLILHVGLGDPARAILQASRDVLADLIVIGSREHHGLERRVWGSITRQVMEGAAVSVLVSRPLAFARGERVPVIEPARRISQGERHLAERHTYHFHRAPMADRNGSFSWGM